MNKNEQTLNEFMDKLVTFEEQQTQQINKQRLVMIEYFIRGNKITTSGKCIDQQGIEYKEFTMNSGYKYIYFKYYQLFIHRIQAFEKYRDKLYITGYVVRHKDDDKLNNSFYNVLIGTRADNWSDWRQNNGIGKSVQKQIEERLLNNGYVVLQNLYNDYGGYVCLNSFYNLIKRLAKQNEQLKGLKYKWTNNQKSRLMQIK